MNLTSSVNKMTDYWSEDWGFYSRHIYKLILISTASRPALGPPIQCLLPTLPRLKQPVLETDHPFPLSVDTENA